MAFRYETYNNPYAGSIAEILGRKGDIRADAARQAGQAQARGAELAGMSKANMIGSITQGGQQILGSIGSIMEQKRNAPAIAQERALQMRERFAKIAQIEQALEQNAATAEEGKLAQAMHQTAMRESGGDPHKAADWLLANGWPKLAAEARKAAPARVPNRQITTRAADGSETTQIVPDTPGQEFRSDPPPKEPKTFPVTVPGPNGQPIRKLVPEAELIQGVQEYRAPNTGGSSGLTANAESLVVNRLSNRWTAASKPARELDAQVRLMEEGIKASRAGNLNAGGQAVLVTFQKILDPNSVVRESEFDRSREGQSLLQRAKGAMERLTQGGPGVPLAELEKYAALAKQIAAAQKDSRLDAIKAKIGREADHFKIPRMLVFEDEPGASVAPVVTAPAGATGGTVRMRAPNGQIANVPVDQVNAAKAKGATVVP